MLNSLTLSTDKLISSILNPKIRFQMPIYGKTLCDSGWNLPSRIISDHLIYYIEKGSIQGKIKQNYVQINSEDLIWVQPGVKHEFEIANGGNKSTILFFRFFIGNKFPFRIRPDYLHIRQVPFLLPIFREMLPDAFTAESFKNSYLRFQIGQLLCRLLVEPHPFRRKNSGLGKIQKALSIDYIRKNIEKRFSLKDIAEHVGLNTDYFSRSFKKTFQIPPKIWIKKLRIERACSLLSETNLSISQIAYKLGFNDIYLFSKQFKASTGESPRSWRNRVNS